MFEKRLQCFRTSVHYPHYWYFEFGAENSKRYCNGVYEKENCEHGKPYSENDCMACLVLSDNRFLEVESGHEDTN